MSDRQSFVTASAAGITIQTYADIAEALNGCVGGTGLLLTEAALGRQFFDLRTGVAGELFQKFTNYRLPIAIVLADHEAYGQRFSELAREHRGHNLIRFFYSLEPAQAWLARF
jgi:hypothetical protein